MIGKSGAGIAIRPLFVSTVAVFAWLFGSTQAFADKVVYNCHDNTALNATFDNNAGTLTLEIGPSVTVRLNSTVSGSGMRFVGGGYEAYGKANWLNIIRPGQTELKCNEIGGVGTPATAQSEPPAPVQPQQAATPSFGCSGRLNATEARICASPNLADLDNKMASTYSWLLGRLPSGEQNRLKQDQRQWLGQRNRCGSNDQCIEGQYLDRTAYLNEWFEPGSPQQPPQAQGGGFAAKSWGGIVRSGPGVNYAKIASLNEGERITVLQQTRQYYQDRPWFQISFRGRTGYHWGGIICPIDRAVPGTYQVCN